MGKYLINHRESRLTITNGYVVLPAESKKDESRGGVVVITPTKTAYSDADVKLISEDKAVKPLFDARDPRILEWGDSFPEEPSAEEASLSKKSEPEKPLDKMNREELVRRAQELNIPVANEDTKAVLLNKIQAATAV